MTLTACVIIEIPINKKKERKVCVAVRMGNVFWIGLAVHMTYFLFYRVANKLMINDVQWLFDSNDVYP